MTKMKKSRLMEMAGLVGLKPLKEEEDRDIYDYLAQAEFDMDYDQLGSNEKEWVQDEIENTGGYINRNMSESTPLSEEATIEQQKALKAAFQSIVKDPNYDSTAVDYIRKGYYEAADKIPEVTASLQEILEDNENLGGLDDNQKSILEGELAIFTEISDLLLKSMIGAVL